MIKITLEGNTKRIEFLREKRKSMPSEFIWDNRYSDTSELDKHGRWMRICYVKFYEGDEEGLWMIGRINKVERVYNFHTEFPVTGNMAPQFSDICYSEGMAKEMIELLWTEFKMRMCAVASF